MDLHNVKETIRIHKGRIRVAILVMTGKEGEFYVTLSPSLHVSGYGRTKEEAEISFDENIKLFCSDLTALDKSDIDKELRELGFKKEFLHNKNFSKSYVDEDGILQNFEEGTLETKIYSEMTCA